MSEQVRRIPPPEGELALPVSAVPARPEFAGLARAPVDEQTLERVRGIELEDTRPRGRS